MEVPDAGRMVVDNVVNHFDMTPANVAAYVGRSLHTMNAQSIFLQPGVHRYILMAVDPAGGGKQSDEALIVFLIANNQFGLLTGCLLGAYHRDFPFSVVPMVFLLGLLGMVRAVKAELFRMHRVAGFSDQSFVMPSVLVLLENNFAYGAAVYLHLLYFLERKRSEDPELKDVDILFATPVYGMDKTLVQLLLDRMSKQTLVKNLTEELKKVMDEVSDKWKSYKRTRMWNFADIKKRVSEKLKTLKVRDTDLPQNIPQTMVETEVAAVLMDVITEMAVINPALAEEIRTNRADDFKEPFTLMTFLQNEIRVARATLASIESLIKEPKKPREEDGGRNGQGHQQFRVRPWPEEHRVDPNTDRIVYPEGFYYNAKRSTFGMQTSESEKAMTFNYFVHLVLKSSHPMSLLVPVAAAPRAHDCTLLRQAPNGRFHRIASGEELFQCIMNQWVHLHVEVDKQKIKTAVRITGKQPGPIGEGVQKDDLWMAFSKC